MVASGISWACEVIVVLYLMAALLMRLVQIEERKLVAEAHSIFRQLKDAIRSVRKTPAQKAVKLFAQEVLVSERPLVTWRLQPFWLALRSGVQLPL
ncbi:hypothetical protein SBO82_00450 [Alcaligenes nematophilus]|uniref:hypothetical protein n=1 Tax=Alcaligenes nematophilus TaxID=2994643 RepID=UPI0024601B21|nr:hypothetical protein [Alcaligenes nematophilus]MDH4865428.1 hypothetical protein [Bacillus cereus]MDY7126727.1 hypothetical protein [Alcaligenes nematophilus]